jgi:uncharacterized membrane protein
MLIPVAASLYQFILAIHIMAVVAAFGVTFAYPIMFMVAAKHQPNAIPVLHRIEYTLARMLINPLLVVVVAAGVYLASDGHHWSEFFVQWGLGAVIVIGAVVGAVLIPASKKAEEVATRDLAAATGSEPVRMSAEYRALVRRLTVFGSLMSALVLLTILFMAIQP